MHLLDLYDVLTLRVDMNLNFLYEVADNVFQLAWLPTGLICTWLNASASSLQENIEAIVQLNL